MEFVLFCFVLFDVEETEDKLFNIKQNKRNSMALAHKRTIPTERPLLLEANANF
jgi:hypothetical protein